jgi:glycolate oxidase FAD binding subunit
MTQWMVGGEPKPGTRLVRAPSGIVSHEPAEMIVRVRAGTTLAELQAALGESRQHVALEAAAPADATVGGIVSVAHGGVRRLGWGPVRDAVLEVTAVSAAGELIRSGAPLVKNVTGYDLCRLLVGSIGTLAVIAEVVLRCNPLPEAERWWVGRSGEPLALAERLYRPLAVLWDGQRTWVGMSGYLRDLDSQAAEVLGPGFAPVDGPPPVPQGHRWSIRPAEVASLPRKVPGGGWIAEVGVGLVHLPGGPAGSDGPVGPIPVSPALRRLHEELKSRFDPRGRMNPGRTVLAGQ